MPSRDLTVNEAAGRLGIKPSVLLHAIGRHQKGKTGLPATRFGRQWQVKPADVAAYAQRRGNRLGKAGRTPAKTA